MSAEAGSLPLAPREDAGTRPAGGARRLEDIYAPIEVELGRLREFLRAQFEAEEPFICQLLDHIERFRGKQIRPALLLIVGKLGGGIVEDHVKIAAVIELVHTATLIHDDILDDAAIRRNVETLHRKYGERAGILLGDFLYSRAFALSTEVPGMAALLSATTNTICEGELLQVGNRFRPDMGEEVYLEIIRKKTAILYAEACAIGGLLSGVADEAAERLHAYGMDIGMAFQIIDDCLDYSGDEAVVGKSLGTDLHQGKVTLPLIYLIDDLRREGDRRLVDALRRPLSTGVEARIAREVRERGALEAAVERARSFIDSARSRLAGMEPALRDALSRIAEYVLHRRR